MLDTGLKGTNALITGGASGIGLGIATVLAREGANLAIASRNPDQTAIAALRSYGVRVLDIKADVSKEDQVERMVRTAIEELGGLDAYVNNAAWTWHQPATKVTTEFLENTMRTNLYACIWSCREVARHMISRRQGSIVIIGSTAAYTPQATETSYRVSKVGLMAYKDVLAIELAPFGIRVNMVIPGYFPTRMTAGLEGEHEEMLFAEIPLRRAGDPTEVGVMAAMLLSDRLASYTTGTSVLVDGGLHLRPLPSFSDEELIALNT
jgi:3-oxoacyl-[acyl-carrier protein] reductase